MSWLANFKFAVAFPSLDFRFVNCQFLSLCIAPKSILGRLTFVKSHLLVVIQEIFPGDLLMFIDNVVASKNEGEPG